MIPWATFGSNELPPDWRIELTEYNLLHYVGRGPNQLTRSVDSLMLEQAHERQFAIAQLGTKSVGFEAEHKHRVDLALQRLDYYFSTHPSNETERPISPYLEYIPDFRTASFSYEPLPPLQISDIPSPAPSLLPRPASKTHVSNSRLSVESLMNPEPSQPENSESLLEPSSPTAVDDIVAEDLYQFNSSMLSIMRVSQPDSARGRVRTHRETRMRRPSKAHRISRVRSVQKALEADEAEKEMQPFMAITENYHQFIG